MRDQTEKYFKDVQILVGDLDSVIVGLDRPTQNIEIVEQALQLFFQYYTDDDNAGYLVARIMKEFFPKKA